MSNFNCIFQSLLRQKKKKPEKTFSSTSIEDIYVYNYFSININNYFKLIIKNAG